MQAKISTGNDCLRFPQVTGGNLPAPAGKLREAFIVPVRSAFFKPRDVSFYPVSNNLTNVTPCCLWGQWQNPSKLILFQKNLDCSLLAFQGVIQKKTFQWKILHYHQNDRELAVVTFWFLSQFSSERIMSSKSKIWSWMPLEKQCILYQIEHCWNFENLWIIRKEKERGKMLLIVQKFLQSSKIQFPRAGVTK